MARRYALSRPRISLRKIDFEKELNPQQLKVVTGPAGPTLVLAGPGSGKTRTLTYRVARLLEQGVAPDRILLVTFTVKAAREMLDRVERIVGAPPEGLWGGTFHHIGNLILRRHAQKLSRTPAFGILDEEDAKDLIQACIKDLKIPATNSRLPQAGVLESIMSFCANTTQTLEQVVLNRAPQFLEIIDFIRRVESAYQKRKAQANLMDYDDLLTGWLTLLRENKEIRERYAEQFTYLLVDEYQDTNRVQFEIIREMGSSHCNILAVGDDAQAIYAFRGADLNNILTFPDVFPNTILHRLETNYRSTPEILHLANASIHFNVRQFPKELQSVKDPGRLPAVVPLTDVKQQAAFVAQRVLEIREEGTPLKEMVVLFRARFQAAELELELAKRNIPYLVRGGVRFFEQAHIKDVLAYLRILANPHDELAWERVLRLQEGIGAATAHQVWGLLSQKSDPLSRAFQGREEEDLLPARSLQGWRKLIRTLGQLRNRSLANAPAEMIQIILKTGYEAHLETHFENARDRKEDLEQLAVLAASYDSAERFLQDVTLREPFRGETIVGWEEPDEFLVLSTIHQAKGLEWDAVFFIGLVENQFPHPKSIEDPEALEEERRLFYVAVTRTKRELYLTYPVSRYSYQRGEILMRPSPFLQELPEDLVELWQVGEGV